MGALLVKQVDCMFILLKLGDADVGVTVKSASRPVILMLTVWSGIVACGDMGGFCCTSNMKSYDILDLVSHFSRNDGERGGRHQDIPDPWCQSHDPRAPGQGSAPRLPMRASPARHKAHEPSPMGWGRAARKHSLWPEYSGIYEIGHLHEESQLRALCFGFAVI